MLVLTRKLQESVVIQASDDLPSMLEVTVLQIRGGEVRLGFKAPTEVVISRLELWERIHGPAPRRPWDHGPVSSRRDPQAAS